jgi:hypothetical protein
MSYELITEKKKKNTHGCGGKELSWRALSWRLKI